MPAALEVRKRWRAKISQWTPRHLNRKTNQAATIPSGIPYIYTPIPRGYIRLLTIQSFKKQSAIYRLDTYSQQLAPQYDAVSYCWGEDQTPITINCNGSDLRIRQSLSQALPYMADRPTPLRPLWIDAICLNQEDADEKATQVPLMHEIYRNATRTVVWLGEPDKDTDVALDFMAEVTTHLQKGRDPKGINKWRRGREWKALREYLRRPWFDRVWVLQEVLLSQDIEILCHSHKFRTISWQKLNNFMITLKKHDVMTSLLDEGTESKPSIHSNVTNMESSRRRVRETKSLPLFTLLNSCTSRRCHEPVDRIWALLGLLPRAFVVEIQRASIVDYSDSGKREYWKSYLAVMKVLHTCNVYDFDTTFYWGVGFPKNASLPSWCPDFSSGHPTRPFRWQRDFRSGFANDEESAFSTTKLYSAGDALSVIGFCVDEVRSVTSVNPGFRAIPSYEEEIEYDGRWVLWLEECKHLTQETLGESEEAVEAMGQALLAVDREKENNFSGGWAQCYQCLHDKRQTIPNWDYSCPHGQPGEHLDYYLKVGLICLDHKFFATTNGRIGLGPAKLQAGDKICVFAGAETLYVLRDTAHESSENNRDQRTAQEKQPECAQETFSLIGDAYVHGLMFGEAFTADGRGPERELIMV